MVKIEIISNPICGECQKLKAALKERGVKYVDLDVTTFEGMGMAAWYGSPDVLPMVAVDGELLDKPWDVLERVK